MSIAGEAVRPDESPRERAAGDFGGLRHELPRAVVRATSHAGVAQALRSARQQGLKVAARGTGHTTRGQSLVRDGVVIDTAGLGEIEVLKDTVRVGAGARWHQVLQATLARGLMPPTLTDYLGLSVGGTLSVGGVGGQSFRHGLQVDQVDALTVVTGDAEIVDCSATHREDLFQVSLAGLGQCGIIVSATVRLLPAPSVVRVYRLPCATLASFLSAQKCIADSRLAHYLLGSIVPVAQGWRYEIEVCEYVFGQRTPGLADLLAELAVDGACGALEEMGLWQHASRLDAMVVEMRRAGTWDAYHPWMDLFVPDSGAHRVIANALSAVDPGDVADGHIMTYPLRRPERRATLVPWPDEPYSVLFDILPSFRRDDHHRLTRFQSTLQRILPVARAHGATVYPIGYPIGTAEMTPAHWRRQFGPRWDSLLAGKRRYDPDGLLTPGPGIF